MSTFIIIGIVIIVVRIIIQEVRARKNRPAEKAISELITEGNYQAAFAGIGLSSKWPLFQKYIRKSIEVITEPVDETQLIIGASKIGGIPDLPKNVEWFREENGKSLSFLAQMNLETIKECAAAELLPKKGMLYFFYSAEQESWGFSPSDKDKFKVYFHPDNSGDLIRTNPPQDLPSHSIYKPNKVYFKERADLPSWEYDFISTNITSDELERMQPFHTDDGGNKLLGYPDIIQNAMEEECQLVTNGLNCGSPDGYNDPKASGLAKNSMDWILLFQIDSEEDKTGMMWGDAGRLYFWIKKQDLSQCNFNNCWAILQCY